MGCWQKPQPFCLGGFSRACVLPPVIGAGMLLVGGKNTAGVRVEGGMFVWECAGVD